MRIKLSAVFLSANPITVTRDGKKEERLLGKFHQPKEQDNMLLSVVLPSDVNLDPYQSYEIDGKLNTWVFRDSVMSRIEVIDIREE